MPIDVNCNNCNKGLKVKPSKFKRQKYFFCSIPCKNEFQKGKPTWNKGKKLQPLSKDHKLKIGIGVSKNPNVKATQFKKGHIVTNAMKEKRKKTIQETGCLSGKNNGMYGKDGNKNPNWKGGISYWRKEYYNSLEYKDWRKKVFKRDGFTCKICNTKNKELHAHHIKSFASYPKLRLIVDNGVTLCIDCHILVHTKKFMIGKVLSVERTDKIVNMVDIEVKDNNNFFANGILVHNSATPYREDGRTDYIFALTGFPIGLDWNNLLELGIIEQPDIRLYVVKTKHEKIKKLAELLEIPMKTLIFCDSIDFGNKLSKQFEIPFIYGASSKRLEVIRGSETCVVSRVGDEGVSLPDIERVIEIDFLFGSRRQEGQRMGRLFHGESRGKHIILMTEEEREKYGKRLYAIYSKGFKIEVVRV